jgi:hypothetical protein
MVYLYMIYIVFLSYWIFVIFWVLCEFWKKKFPQESSLHHLSFVSSLCSSLSCTPKWGRQLGFCWSSLLSTVSKSDWLWAGWLRGWSLSPDRVKNFHFSMLSRLALGSTQPLVQEALSPGVKLTTHLQLVPRSRKHGFVYPLPHMPSWGSA